MALVMSVRLIRLPVADRSLFGVAVAVDDGKTLNAENIWPILFHLWRS